MRRSVKILLGLLAALLLAVVFVLNPRLPTPEGEQSGALYRPGSLDVASEAIELRDSSRPTAANGAFTGSPVRELDGYLWYPQEQQHKPYPLIVYSHGFMSSVAEAQYLVDFLVPKGYVMVAVDYPLTHGAAPGGPNVTDVIHQPGDVSFIIDTLLDRNADESDALYGMLDPSRIAAVGLSLGGLTTQLAAYHRDLREPRLSAVVSIAGPSVFLERQFFQTRNIPFMMIAGSSDAMIPYQANAAPIPAKVDGGRLVTLDKGSHVGFAGMSTTLFRWFDHPDRMVCPLLVSALEREDGAAESILVADPEIGISSLDEVPCSNASFERAMRPAQQQMLTRLAVYAFLEHHFAEEAARRQQMQQYLDTFLAAENPAVQVQ